MAKTIIATAKHDCNVTLTMSLDSISLNKLQVVKGEKINFPVHKDEVLSSPRIVEVLGTVVLSFVMVYFLCLRIVEILTMKKSN